MDCVRLSFYNRKASGGGAGGSGLRRVRGMAGAEAMIAEAPDATDLVPPEPSAAAAMEGGSASSFPKVLRRRLDRFFAEANVSPKADTTMWGKIALGGAVLAGSWIALYALHPPAWAFLALYVLGGLAQTFLLLNIAHDSNHNAISSRSAINKSLNYVFDLCGISSYMWRILHHRGHHSCINLHGEDDAIEGRGLFRFTPHDPRTPLHRFQHIYALFLYALFSLEYVFVRDFQSFFFPGHAYLTRTKHPLREYVVLFAGKAFYLTYMLVLPVFRDERASAACACGVLPRSSDHGGECRARFPNDAHHRGYVLPSSPQ